MDGASALQEEGWQLIRRQLPQNFRALAERLGLIHAVPEQLHAKVRDIEPLLRVVLFMVAADVSLRSAAAQAAAAHLLELSAVALHLWMRRIGDYLEVLLALLWGAPQRFSPQKWAGYLVVVADGSSVAGPGASGMTARLHYAIRLPTAEVLEVHLTPPSQGESFKRFSPQPGELWMGDRGYSNANGVWAVLQRGADVVVRYTRGTLPLVHAADGSPVDALALARLLEGEKAWAEWEVVVPGNKQRPPIAGRLILQRLPEEKAEEARARVQREAKGKPVSAETLEWAGYLALFTTVPKERLGAEMLLALYPARWQVELAIKRDKSLCGLSNLPNKREDTVKAWLAAKLLAITLADRLGQQAEAFSPSAPAGPLPAVAHAAIGVERAGGSPAAHPPAAPL